jgi:hypothetical protein
MVGRLANQHTRAVGFVSAFDARRQIHGIADDRVVAGLLRADAAHHNVAGGDADADVDLRETAFEADEIRQLGTKRGKASNLIEGGEVLGSAHRFSDSLYQWLSGGVDRAARRMTPMVPMPEAAMAAEKASSRSTGRFGPVAGRRCAPQW